MYLGDFKLRQGQESLNLVEERLKEKRQEVIRLEDTLSKLEFKYEAEYETKMREALRKARKDIDDEWKFRLQAVESEANEENNEIKQQLQRALQTISELQSKLLSSQSHVSSVKISEIHLGQEAVSKPPANEMKNLWAQQEKDIETLKEYNKSITEQLAKSQEELKATQEEYEIAKQDAKLTVADNQVVHNALVQATQRLHDADIESGNLRAENSFLLMRFENVNGELKTIKRDAQEGDERFISVKLNNRKMEMARVEERSQSFAKIKEFEKLNMTLQDQISQQEVAFLSTRKDFEALLEKKSFEIIKLKDALVKAETEHKSAISKVNRLEIAALKYEESLKERDFILTSVKREYEFEISNQEQVHKTLKIDIDNLKENLRGEQGHKRELQNKYAEDLLTIEKEIEITVPKIADDVAGKVHKNWEKRMKAEIGSIQLRYESEIESLKKEILEIHSSFAERDARRRLQLADEKIEIENMRLLIASLKRAIGADDEPAKYSHQQYLIPISAATGVSDSVNSKGSVQISSKRERSEKIKSGYSEEDMKSFHTEAFSQLQAQVNTMKHELTNTMISQMKSPLKSFALSSASNLSDGFGEG